MFFFTKKKMSKIRIHDQQFAPYYSKEKIADAVSLLAKKLKADLKNEILATIKDSRKSDIEAIHSLF